MSGGGYAADREAFKAALRQLRVDTLKGILEMMHTKKSGNKQDLVQRISDTLETLPEDRFHDVLLVYMPHLLRQPAAAPPRQLAMGGPVSLGSRAAMTAGSAPGYGAPVPNGFGAETLHFEESPFFQVVQKLTDAHRTDAAGVNISFFLPEDVAANMTRNPMLRLYLYATRTLSWRMHPNAAMKVELPRPARYRLNSAEHVLPGSKQKPAHQAPLDLSRITTRFYPGAVNQLDVQLATQQGLPPPEPHVLKIQLVQKVPLENVLAKISSGENLSANARFELTRATAHANAQQSKHNEDDVMAVAVDMSLSCPIGLTRVLTPIKGVYCRHAACFDARNFLAMNERSPTWQCPVCAKDTPFDTLFVDQKFVDILRSVPATVNSVVFEPNGSWKLPVVVTPPVKVKPEPYEDPFRTTTPQPVANTNGSSSANRATLFTPPASGPGSKAATPNTISLLSDDEDDDAAPASSSSSAPPKQPAPPAVSRSTSTQPLSQTDRLPSLQKTLSDPRADAAPPSWRSNATLMAPLITFDDDDVPRGLPRRETPTNIRLRIQEPSPNAVFKGPLPSVNGGPQPLRFTLSMPTEPPTFDDSDSASSGHHHHHRESHHHHQKRRRVDASESDSTDADDVPQPSFHDDDADDNDDDNSNAIDDIDEYFSQPEQQEQLLLQQQPIARRRSSGPPNPNAEMIVLDD